MAKRSEARARRKAQVVEEGPVMARDPLADEESAEDASRSPANRLGRPQRRHVTSAPTAKGRGRAPLRGTVVPQHYKIVSISLYNEDIDKIDSLVARLKKLGHTKANRSMLIRYAVDSVDVNAMPKAY